MRLTSANSVNIGRLLPQMVYYFHAIAQLRQRGQVGRAAGRRVLDAERQFRQPDRRADGEARRAADRALRRRDQRQRRRAGVSRDRPLRAAAFAADARQRDGRRPSEQLRAHAVAVRRRSRRDAPRRHRLPVQRRRGARRRSGGSTRNAAICSIRTARSPTWGSWGRMGGTGRSACFSRPRIRRSSREIVEPIIGRPIEKPAALAEALARPAAHHPHPRLARSRARHARWLIASAIARTCSSTCWCTASVRPNDTAAGTGARLRPRPLQVRDPQSARALPAPGISEDRIRRAASTSCAAAIRCWRCRRASSSSRSIRESGSSWFRGCRVCVVDVEISWTAT